LWIFDCGSWIGDSVRCDDDDVGELPGAFESRLPFGDLVAFGFVWARAKRGNDCPVRRAEMFMSGREPMAVRRGVSG